MKNCTLIRHDDKSCFCVRMLKNLIKMLRLSITNCTFSAFCVGAKLGLFVVFCLDFSECCGCYYCCCCFRLICSHYSIFCYSVINITFVTIMHRFIIWYVHLRNLKRKKLTEMTNLLVLVNFCSNLILTKRGIASSLC
jgi:hypothetical protein